MYAVAPLTPHGFWHASLPGGLAAEKVSAPSLQPSGSKCQKGGNSGEAVLRSMNRSIAMKRPRSAGSWNEPNRCCDESGSAQAKFSPDVEPGARLQAFQLRSSPAHTLGTKAIAVPQARRSSAGFMSILLQVPSRPASWPPVSVSLAKGRGSARWQRRRLLPPTGGEQSFRGASDWRWREGRGRAAGAGRVRLGADLAASWAAGQGRLCPRPPSSGG